MYEKLLARISKTNWNTGKYFQGCKKWEIVSADRWFSFPPCCSDV